MIIRNATEKDLPHIVRLLEQVLEVHHSGRPDLFKGNCRKYTDSELLELMNDKSRPIFVADDGKNVVGYAFCIITRHLNDNILTDIKTLYIDDLCVDENVRGNHIGKSLYNYATKYAKEIDCYNVTLNVWACNKSALKFYETCNLTPQKITMEKIL